MTRKRQHAARKPKKRRRRRRIMARKLQHAARKPKKRRRRRRIMARKRQHAARKPKKRRRRRRRRIMARKRQHAARKPKKRRQRGGKVDIQKKIEKLGIEFHPFSLSKRKRYQYLGPGTFLKKRLVRGDPGINRLDRIAKQHDIDYSNAKNIRDKWKADLKMVHAIDALPGKKLAMEKLSRNIIAAKRKFKL